MKKILTALLCALLGLAAAAADAQTNVRIRGTVAALDGNVLSVKSRDGRDLKIQLADNAAVVAAKAITLNDLKPGEYVGVTSVRDPEGKLIAREVHTIARSVAEGHTPWDLEPNSNMTNANIAKSVKAAKGNELTLEYKGGTQTILVPDGVPVVTQVPADRALLTPGTYVFLVALSDADGKLSTARVQAAKDGVRPPQ
jgi:hypothetical protein